MSNRGLKGTGAAVLAPGIADIAEGLNTEMPYESIGSGWSSTLMAGLFLCGGGAEILTAGCRIGTPSRTAPLAERVRSLSERIAIASEGSHGPDRMTRGGQHVIDSVSDRGRVG